ncbi:hypothetical protein V8G54_009394 [Vigna mungo]|uniref:Uncharacterized protein n=1 Tax=Vigna mungo TaxID=3915 RepID=A0AAQ3S3T6_VIGMU
MASGIPKWRVRTSLNSSYIIGMNRLLRKDHVQRIAMNEEVLNEEGVVGGDEEAMFGAALFGAAKEVDEGVVFDEETGKEIQMFVQIDGDGCRIGTTCGNVGDHRSFWVFFEGNLTCFCCKCECNVMVGTSHDVEGSHPSFGHPVELKEPLVSTWGTTSHFGVSVGFDVMVGTSHDVEGSHPGFGHPVELKEPPVSTWGTTSHFGVSVGFDVMVGTSHDVEGSHLGFGHPVELKEPPVSTWGTTGHFRCFLKET